MAEYTVEPLSPFDVGLADCVLDLRFIIEGQLDGDKLLNGLYSLIVKRWPMAGARLATSSENGYELRIPRQFDEANPPLYFDEYQIEDEITLDSCFQRSPEDLDKTAPTVLLGHMNFIPKNGVRLRRPDSAQRRHCTSRSRIRKDAKELVRCGGPLLHVELYNFAQSNESVVRVIFPHVVYDAASMASLLRAWSLSLAGRVYDVPDLLSINELPNDMHSDKLQYPPPNHFPFKRIRLVLFSLAQFWRNTVCSYILRWRTPKPVRRSNIFVPQAFIDHLRDEAMRFAPSADAFVSDGDLCSAWLLHSYAQERRSLRDGFARFTFQANIRMLIPSFRRALGIKDEGTMTRSSSLMQASRTFLHNAATCVGIYTKTWYRVARTPPAQLAWQIRSRVNQLKASSTAEEFKSEWAGPFVARQRKEALLPMPWYAQLCISSSWLQADVFGSIDFRPAVTEATLNAGRAKELFLPPLEVFLPSANGHLSASPALFYLDIIARIRGKGIFICSDLDDRSVKRGLFGHWRELGEDNVIDYKQVAQRTV